MDETLAVGLSRGLSPDIPQGHHRRLAQDAGHLPSREEGHQAARRPLLATKLDEWNAMRSAV